MDQAILEYIMNLSKQTRIKVCVEGVENEEILSVVQTYKPELHTIIPDPVRRRNFQRNISMEKIRQAATVV